MTRKLLLLLSLLLWQPLAGAIEAEGEILPSEQAFKVRAIAKDANTY